MNKRQMGFKNKCACLQSKMFSQSVKCFAQTNIRLADVCELSTTAETLQNTPNV